MVQGTVDTGYERVREVFRGNFDDRGEIGASLVVRRHGKVVVDLWGGFADPGPRRPWTRDTPCVVFSATKGWVALVVLMLHERGLVDLDAPVAELWPEFGVHGKEAISVRTLLNHRSGLSVIDAPLTIEDFARPDGIVHAALVAQVPTFEPGSAQAYGACAWGAFVGEVVRRATGASVGQWFDAHIAAPLQIDAWIGLPSAVAPRVARLIPVGRRERLRRQISAALLRRNPEGRLFRRVAAGRRSLAGRAFLNPTLGPRVFEALNDPTVLALELPWMNGVASADAISKIYAATLGEIDGVRLVRGETLAPLAAPQSWSERDGVLQREMGWSQGFVKEKAGVFTSDAGAFGHPGAGGCLGWASPRDGLSIGYVMNRMDWRIRSPRAMALCRAVQEAVDAGA